MADQTVTVNLQLLYDPRSGRAFQQMAQEAAKASKAANRAVAGEFAARSQALAGIGGMASNLGAYGAANSIGRTGAFADGLQQSGMTGAARFAQRAAVPLAVAGALGSGAQNVAGYAYDRYSTNAQVGRSIVRDFVPFGTRAQSFVDSMSGRKAGYEAADINAQYAAARVQNTGERSAFDLGFKPQQAGREALATAYRGQRAITGSVFDRSTSEGERAFREEQRILPLKQAEAKAERDMAVASKEQLATQTELNRIQAKGVDLQRRRSELANKLAGGGSGVDRQNVLKQLEGYDLALDVNQGQRREAAGANQAAQQRAIEARTERQKAAVRSDLLGQAEVIASRVERAESATQRIGSMNPFDRAKGFAAARFFRGRDSIDGAPEDYIASAAAIDPELIGKLREKSAKNDPNFKRYEADFPGSLGGDPELLRRKEAELRREAGEAEFKLDSGAAGQIAETGREFGRAVGNALRDALKKAEDEILRKILLGRNAN